ncbi:hypothetical protein JCM8097_003477 [Rhodosporidiobolus ruineniae]
MGRKRQGVAKTPFILRLPPHLLRLILCDEDCPVTLANLTICKALLPYTIEALYHDIALVHPVTLAKFDARTRAQPKLLELICRCGFEDPSTRNPEAPGAVNEARRRLGRGKSRHSSPPSTFSLTDDIALLPRLAAFPGLRTLEMSTPDSLDEDFPPLPHLNTQPELYLAPRSLALVEIALEGPATSLPPDYRALFMACRRLTQFELVCAALPPSFASDLSLFPPSLRSLTLKIGRPCPDYGSAGESLSVEDTFPKLDDILPSFPHLHQLSLQGYLLQSLDSLCALPRLAHLSLGPHTRCLPSSLLRLLPPALPSLSDLVIHLCTCFHPDGQRSRRVYAFSGAPPADEGNPDGSSITRDSEALLREAERTGVLVEGNFRHCIFASTAASQAYEELQ